VFKPLGSMSLETRTFDAGGQLPKLDWLMSIFGLSVGSAPFNISFLLALLVSFGVWVLIWRTKLGYEMRTMGHSPAAARYAGIKEAKIIIENWRQHYNTVRPHSSLGYKPPAPEAVVWPKQNGPASTPTVASRPIMH